MRQNIIKSKSLNMLFVFSLLFMCSVVWAERFTIAVIPDTQNYTNGKYLQPASTRIFEDEMQFIADNISPMNIVFISHVGDVVNNAEKADQWPRAISAINILKNTVPMSIVPGNHDYDDRYNPISGLDKWTECFGADSDYFLGKSWYGGSFINNSDTSGGSSYQTFEAGGYKFLHIGLEMEPCDDVLAWAQKVIDDHRDWPTILTTHAYMHVRAGERLKIVSRADSPSNSAQQIWDKLITVNPQIFMLLCGHCFLGETSCSYYRSDLNDAGKRVHQIVANYQNVKSSIDGTLGKGGGWVRFMEFNPELKMIRVRTYSTLLHKFSDDPTLTDGRSYAKTWAPFNYDVDTGFLIPENDPRRSSFTLPWPD